jgi:hypothetical protein
MQVIYPEKKPSIKSENGKEFIFCLIRKKWLVITPEEWVRQNFILYLTETLQFPASLIAVEKQLLLSEVKKRFDIVVYDNQALPLILVECKEMNEPLSQSVLYQALNYFKEIQSRYLVITNGNHTIAYQKRGEAFFETDNIVQ